MIQISWGNILNYLLFFGSKLGDISFFDGKKEELTDNEIIKRIKNGEKDYFEKIVDKYGDKMFRYAYYQFNFSKENAEEVVEDIFLKVWNNLDNFDENTNFNSWIYRLAHNLILDKLKKKEINLIEKDILDLNLHSEQTNELENKYKKELLENLLSQLKPEYKEAIILYYFEDKSYDEIAYILGTTKNTVGSWIKRTKDKLKEIIENNENLKQALIFDL